MSSVRKAYLKKTLKALVTKEEIDKLDSITFKNFCSLEDTIKRQKNASYRMWKDTSTLI